LQIKSKEAAENKLVCETKLEKAEPALIDAQNAVQGVTKGNIDEIKNFANPPAAVKLALEPVISLLLNLTKAPDWAVIKAEVKKDKFKESILSFKKESISTRTKNFIV